MPITVKLSRQRCYTTDHAISNGTISADCPAGDYTLRASISDANGAELASATASFSVAAPEPAPSTDATLSSLALSGVTLEFDSDTTWYAAEVGNDLAETTVSPTVNDDGATYVVRLDGAVDDDGTVPLSVGGNVISVLVTAEDGETTETYTVTVTRAEAATSGPTVAIALSPSDTMIEGEGTEIAVTLSFGNLTFDDDRTTTDYVFRADVKDSEDGDADGCEEQAGGYGLGVDRYMYQVDEDPETRAGTISADCPAGVYTLRASVSNSDNEEVATASAAFYVLPPPEVYEAEEVEQPEEEEPVSGEQNSVDATLSALTVSPTDVISFASGTTTYHVGVANSVTQATITATTNDANATIDIGSTTVNSGTGHQITLSEGLNTVFVIVTAEDGNTDETYRIHIGRGVTAAFGWKASDDFNGVFFAGNGSPRDMWSNGATMWVSDSTDDKIYAYNLATKVRDPGKDFNTLADAGNTDAIGIWSDDATMWVVDNVDNKIYAYNLANKARDDSKDFNTLADAGNTDAARHLVRQHDDVGGGLR